MDLIQAQQPKIWLDKARLEKIKSRIKYAGMLEVSRVGRGGDVVVFWKFDFDFTADTYSPNHIDAIINQGKEDEWRFTGFYEEPDIKNHHVS